MPSHVAPATGAARDTARTERSGARLLRRDVGALQAVIIIVIDDDESDITERSPADRGRRIKAGSASQTSTSTTGSSVVLMKFLYVWRGRGSDRRAWSR